MDESPPLSSPSSSNNYFVDIGVDVEIPNIPSPPTPNTPSPPTPNFSTLHNFLASLITANPPNNVSEPSEVSDTDDIGNEIPIGTFGPLTTDPADPPTEITPEITDPPTDPDSSTPAENPHPIPPLPPQNHNINWRPILITGAILIITLITAVGLLTYFIRPKNSHKPECVEEYLVAIDGKGNFRTISEALEAAPSYNPYRVCIILQSGEYHEIIDVGHDKTNIVLKGEGIERTTIISNASSLEGLDTWTASTLSVNGHGFMARELTIVNTATSGVAVANQAGHSTFDKCRLKGANSTLEVQTGQQFYRDCEFYGRNYLIVGFGDSYFQRCELYGERLGHEEKMVFIGQSNQLLFTETSFTFHLSSFRTSGQSISESPTTLLGSGFAESKSTRIIVMQSYLDASITGYMIQNSTENDFFATFDNSGPGAANMKNVPTCVHALTDMAASDFSLRSYLHGRNWIPTGVDYDLDLVS